MLVLNGTASKLEQNDNHKTSFCENKLGSPVKILNYRKVGSLLKSTSFLMPENLMTWHKNYNSITFSATSRFCR